MGIKLSEISLTHSYHSTSLVFSSAGQKPQYGRYWRPSAIPIYRDPFSSSRAQGDTQDGGRLGTMQWVADTLFAF